MEDSIMNEFIRRIIVGIFIVGTGLTIWKLRIRSRQQSPSLALEAELEALREEQAEQNAALQAHINELEGRLDFAERRLIQQRDEQRRIERPLTPV